MRRELTEIERLALAARAEVAEASFYRRSWLFGVLAVIAVVVALMSEASPYETLVVRIYAALAIFSAVTIWLRWRYSFHAGAALFFAIAVGELVSNWDHRPPTVMGWIARVAFAAVFAEVGYRLVKSGVPFAAVHGQEWEKERTQVRQWLRMLTNLATEEPVFEISTGNFWRGYFTYRFMRRDQMWVVVRLKTGDYLHPLEYKILEPTALRIAPLPDGTLYVQIDGRKLREATVSAEMRESLLRVMGAS